MFESTQGFVTCPITKDVTKERQVNDMMENGIVALLYIPKKEIPLDHPLYKVEPNLIGILLGSA